MVGLPSHCHQACRVSLFNTYPFTCPARGDLTVATLLMAELSGSLAYGSILTT